MRERICQMAAGEIHADVPALELPRTTIEADIAYGQNYRGDIHLSSGNQLAFRGLVYSDDSRVQLPHSTFSGNNIFIPYEVIAEELEAGTVLEGYFSLVYNGGEIRLPYRFRVLSGGKEYETPLVELKDLADYVRTSPAEALELMESRDFAHLPFMEDLAVRGLYDGLRRSADKSDLAEELLCGTGTKEHVMISVDREKVELLVEEKTVSDKLVLTRNTWGYLPVQIRTDHPAVHLEAEDLTDAAFRGDTCEIVYTIDRSRLHAGQNYGRIYVKTPLQDFTVVLVMTRRLQDERRGRKRRQSRIAMVNFTRAFLKVLMHRAKNMSDLDEFQRCWEEVVQCNEPTLRQQLYHAAVCLWRGDRDMAVSLLNIAKPLAEGGRREDVDAYCAYLYLQLQVTQNWERKEQILKILHLYENSEGASEFVFLLMLYMEDRISERPMEMLDRIRGYYAKGSRSPYLYAEACRIYNRYPDILKKLDEFELATLWFGARENYLTEEVSVHVAGLTGQEKRYRFGVCELLKRMYANYDRSEILGGICQMLIRGDRKTPDTFRWYALGVEKDIRLTRLYDYYLQTVPEDYSKPLPREIMLYFSYNSPRDTVSQKVLYRSLYRFASDDERLMNSYQEQMEQFVRQQILAGKVDSGFAEIYRHVLVDLKIDDKLARTLPDILYSVEIRCEQEFSEAIAVYGETEEEFAVPMVHGKACLPIYSDTCRIIFVDGSGIRYAGVPCEMEALFEEYPEKERLLRSCLDLYPRHSMMRLAHCGQILENEERDLTQIRFLRKELETRTLHRQFKKRMMAAIADHIISRNDPEDEDVIACVRYSGITMKQRSELVQILIRQGQLSEASRQARRIGFRELPSESLLRLVSLTIQNGLFTMDETLLDMCRFLFDIEQYDDVILEYLCAHYNSNSADMLPVLLAAERMNVPTRGMEERLLAQMLFTGTRKGLDEVFRVYMAQESGERVLVHAYFAVKCDSYFIDNEPVAEEVFDYVRQLLDDATERRAVPLICVLALMRHYAEKPVLTEEESEICSDLVNGLIRDGMQFAWMKDLKGKADIPETLAQRVWVEYRGAADLDLKIRVILLPEKEKKTPICQVMPQVYPGIYVYSFLLFDGESMMYEIYNEKDQAVLERGTCVGQPSPEDDHSRFAELNRLQKRAGSEEPVTSWQQDVLAFGMKDVWTENIFTIE